MSSFADILAVHSFFSGRGFICTVLSDESKPSLSTDDKLEWISATTAEEIISAILSLSLENASCVVIYFTGHCSDEEVITPSNEYIGMTALRDVILTKCSSESEILSIFDCCEAGNMGLPYVLDDNSFLLADIDNIIEHKIIHIASSLETEESMSSKSRSLFTKYLLQELTKKVIKLPELITNIQSRIIGRGARNQTVCCYSSFRISPVIYSWVLPSGVSIRSREGTIVIS